MDPAVVPVRIRRRALPGAVLALLLLVGAGWTLTQRSGPAAAPPDARPDRIVLTWSGDPATTQSVTWRTDASVLEGAAQIALASPDPAFRDSVTDVEAESEVLDVSGVRGAGLVAQYHSVTFRDLLPDTIYAYRVGDGENWSEWLHFRTASAEPEPFEFLYFGDAQNDILSLWSRAVRSGFRAAPDARFMLHAGDLVDDGHSDREWGEWFDAAGWLLGMVPSIPAAGNHEYRPITTEDRRTDRRHLSVFWNPQFTLPENGVPGLEETSYFLDYQGVRIVVLNSSRAQPEQAAWLDDVLADDPQRWTLVTFHHPIFSSGRDRDNPELRALWKPVLDRHGVDLVLQGHDHTYSRGRAYAGSNLPTGTNARDEGSGTVYVTSVSGRKMYPFKDGGWSGYDAALERRGENMQLFQVIRVAGDTLRYRAHTVTGQPWDGFDLIKAAGANRLIERTPAVADE